MSPSDIKIPARSVRIFMITTETNSPNITPFLKHVRETIDSDAAVDTEEEKWKRNWINDLVHNTLKSVHKLRWRKIRMLANLDKDCIVKQLITSLRNFYPTFNQYYSFVVNDDTHFEVMITITSINQINSNNNISPDAENTIVTIPVKIETRLLTALDTTIDNNVTSTRNVVSDSGKNNNDEDNSKKKMTIVVTFPTIIEVDDYDDALPIPSEFQDFDTFPDPHPPTESWSTVQSTINGRLARSSHKRPTNKRSSSLHHHNSFDALCDDNLRPITRFITKKRSSPNKYKRLTSVVNTSERVRKDLRNIIMSSHRTIHDDPVTEITLSQDTSINDVPGFTLEEKDFEDSDSEDSTLNSMPPFLSRKNGSDDDSSIDSDDRSFYFQNDKANIFEWLECNDEHNNIDDDEALIQTNTSIVDSTTLTSNAVVNVATTTNVLHNNPTNSNNNDNDDKTIKTVYLKESYDKSITSNFVLQSTDPSIHKILAPAYQAFQELSPGKSPRTLKTIKELITSCPSDSLSIDEMQLWINSSKTSLSNSMIEANNITTNIDKGNSESKSLLTSINTTIIQCNLDIRELDRTRKSVLNSAFRIKQTINIVTVWNNESTQMINNISSCITDCKVEHDKLISVNRIIHSHSSETNALVHSLKNTIQSCTSEHDLLNSSKQTINEYQSELTDIFHNIKSVINESTFDNTHIDNICNTVNSYNAEANSIVEKLTKVIDDCNS